MESTTVEVIRQLEALVYLHKLWAKSPNQTDWSVEMVQIVALMKAVLKGHKHE